MQYSIYEDVVSDPMSYRDFINICGPYWEEDWKTLRLKELYNWFNIFSIAVMGYVAISNVQISRININIPKINWTDLNVNNQGFATIYISPSISMTSVSAWAVDIAGVPSILLEQITFAMTNNGISGTPTSGGNSSGNWTDGIKATQEAIPGTNIPKSFVMEGKIVNGKDVWVHGNATKHMGEYINSAKGSVLVENELMASFKNAVNQVLPKVKSGKNFFQNINGWEIGINGDTGVIYHALYK